MEHKKLFKCRYMYQLAILEAAKINNVPVNPTLISINSRPWIISTKHKTV